MRKKLERTARWEKKNTLLKLSIFESGKSTSCLFKVFKVTLIFYLILRIFEAFLYAYL